MHLEIAPGDTLVLDATEVHRDWFLAGLDFQVLRLLIRDTPLRAVLPETVVIESVENHRREHEAAIRAYKAALTKLSLTSRERLRPLSRDDSWQYDEHLRTRVEDLGIECIPAPEVRHEEIALRAATRKAPFDQNGSGYRDTLVWYSCLQLAAQGKNVFLVSGDRDFADNSGKLASALQEEVLELPGRVTLVRQLAPWIQARFPWGAKDLREAAGFARDDLLSLMFAPWDIFESPNLNAEELGLPEATEIHDVSYWGGGPSIDLVKREAHSPGVQRVTYTIPMNFEVVYSVRDERVPLPGSAPNDASSRCTETVQVICEMTVLHDERMETYPFEYDRFTFRRAR